MTSPRREFLSQVGTGVLAATVPGVAHAAPSESIVVGVIGPGGMGSMHLGMLVRRNDVRVAWVCDVDRQRLDRAVQTVRKESGKAPQATTDLRRVLDDAAVDAVFIATPDHWHAPAAILALQAGKHVYVEKPCCHNIQEGRLMTKAVRMSGKVLQVGTQSRSTECVRDAVNRVRGGEIGDVLVTKAWNSQRRGSIGKAQPSPPPEHLDFDTWVGPAPLVPYRKNLLHGIWRWWYDFGCGDIGNDGVHDIDVALWGSGATTHPARVACFGGKYFFDDDQQFPDTQYAVFEYPDAACRQFIFEQRIWTPYVQDGYENGCAWYGTQGVLICGHTVGWRLYGPKNKLLAERSGRADLKAHHDNFFDAVRGQAQPNADVTAGHLSATIVHLANISARLGRSLEFDAESERFPNDADANGFVGRLYRDNHWAVPGAARNG